MQYAKKIVSVLSGDEFYQKYRDRISGGASNFKLAKKRLVQDISIDWIDTIEDCLPNLDTIVRNPRKFIVQEEDIVDISLAKSISTESVKHLAQHTNMISQVDKDGMVTPNRILNITKEESFEIYENRFIYTLLLKLKDFVTMRYDKIKKASATQDILELDVESRFNLPSKKITYRTEYLAQLSFDEVMQLDPETLTKIERIAKIDRIITDFLSSSFAKSMRNSAPVRPPITRTNVILKEPNFKKALTLWQFVETYQLTGGFSTSDDVEDYTVENESVEQLKNMVALNTMLFESLYEEHETDMDMENKEFADFMRVGNMEFEPDKLARDEFAQKPEEDENPEAQHEEDTKPPEKEQENAPEAEPPKAPEAPKEVEKEIEAPPKEFVDTEPNAEEFDRQLFDIRKLYKRPDDDKIKQEDIIKVKDAIDRCFTAYRKIKQEELNLREREERTRLRKQAMERRVAAFKKRKEIVLSSLEKNETAYFGIDPFGNQAIIVKNPIKKTVVEENIKADRNEKLDFDDKDIENIVQSIFDMEKKAAVRAERMAKEDAEEDREYQKALKANKELEDAVYKEKELLEKAKKQKETSAFIGKVQDILGVLGDGAEENENDVKDTENDSIESIGVSAAAEVGENENDVRNTENASIESIGVSAVSDSDVGEIGEEQPSEENDIETVGEDNKNGRSKINNQADCIDVETGQVGGENGQTDGENVQRYGENVGNGYKAADKYRIENAVKTDGANDKNQDSANGNTIGDTDKNSTESDKDAEKTEIAEVGVDKAEAKPAAKKKTDVAQKASTSKNGGAKKKTADGQATLIINELPDSDTAVKEKKYKINLSTTGGAGAFGSDFDDVLKSDDFGSRKVVVKSPKEPKKPD